jgi:hypothetical protein
MNGWKHRKIGAIRFCLAAVIGPYLVIECVQQKMVHYMLPLLPALALLTADFVDRALRNPKLIRPRGWKLGLAAWGLSLLLAAAALCVLAARFASLPRFAVAALALTVIAVVGTVVLLFLARRDGAALVAMGAGTLLAAIVLLAVLLPAFAPLNGLRLASGAMRANGLRPADAVGLVGYSEPSITFYLDGQGQDIGPNFLLTHPTAQWPRWIVISSGCWADLPQTQKNKLSVIGQYQVISSGSKRGNGTIVVARVRAGTDGLASIDAGQSSIASARPK